MMGFSNGWIVALVSLLQGESGDSQAKTKMEMACTDEGVRLSSETCCNSRISIVHGCRVVGAHSVGNFGKKSSATAPPASTSRRLSATESTQKKRSANKSESSSDSSSSDSSPSPSISTCSTSSESSKPGSSEKCSSPKKAKNPKIAKPKKTCSPSSGPRPAAAAQKITTNVSQYDTAEPHECVQPRLAKIPRLISPNASTPPEPRYPLGTEWYGKAVWFANLTDKMSLPHEKPLRPLVFESFCGGTASEDTVFKACSARCLSMFLDLIPTNR